MSKSTRKFISVSEAASICEVDVQTIRVLCRNGTISYRKKSQMYLPNREDVLKYRDTIFVVYEAITNMESYKNDIVSLSKEWEEKRNEIRERLIASDLLPDIIRHMLEFVNAELDKYQDKIDAKTYDIMKKIVSNGSFVNTSESVCLGSERVRQIWYKGLRLFAERETREDEYERQIKKLEEELAKKNLELITCREKIDDEKAELIVHLDKMSAIQARLEYFDLSARCMKCLRSASIETIEDLLKFKRMDLLKIRNFGKKCLCEMDELVEYLNLVWGQSITDALLNIDTDFVKKHIK